MFEPLRHPPDPYANREQKHDAAVLGMWLFLGSEIMLFGGLFMALTVYHATHPAAFEAASRHLSLALGGLNTLVLLTSSLTMALAVRQAQRDGTRLVALLLALTAGLGLVFLGLKFTEYAQHIQSGLLPGPHFRFAGPHAPAIELFFVFYFVMTGLHALHLAVGIGITGLMAVLAWRRAFIPEAYTPVEVAGLYWHLVDIVWIFLFPMLYLTAQR